MVLLHGGHKLEDMDIQAVIRLNELWRAIYPFLARWISRWCPEKTGWVLELGLFSGGINRALMAQRPALKTVCLISQDKVARAVKKQFESSFETAVGALDSLPFGVFFDVVIFRGAFFFLTPTIIRETYRVLKPGAYGILGGGYGPLTPLEEISEIARESKILNYQLGKKWISKGELKEMVNDAGMEKCARIIEDGGLWLLLKKDS